MGPDCKSGGYKMAFASSNLAPTTKGMWVLRFILNGGELVSTG